MNEAELIERLRQQLLRDGRLTLGPRRPVSGRPRVFAMTIAPDWLSIARLPKHLSAAGFDVAALCPTSSFLGLSDFICERHTVPQEGSTNELIEAIAAWQPNLIIPGDEWTVQLLHLMASEGQPEIIRHLIHHSCGDPRYYPVVTNKHHTLAEAVRLGLRVPPTAPIEDLAAFTARYGYPLVIKGAMGAGGRGVCVCRQPDELQAAIAYVSTANIPSFIPSPPLLVQKYIEGYPAAITFVAGNGQWIDGFTYRSEVSSVTCGPSSVIRLINHPEIEQTARRLVARTGFTGYGGFDFVVEHASNAAYLLEMNPRITITGHLGALFGHDLAAGLYAAVTGIHAPASPQNINPEVVALFPHEWWRDPASPYLKNHVVDVPWDDPRLLHHFMTMKNPMPPRSEP